MGSRSFGKSRFSSISRCISAGFGTADRFSEDKMDKALVRDGEWISECRSSSEDRVRIKLCDELSTLCATVAET